MRVVDDCHGEGRVIHQKGPTLHFMDNGNILCLQLGEGTKLHIASLFFQLSHLYKYFYLLNEKKENQKHQPTSDKPGAAGNSDSLSGVGMG